MLATDSVRRISTMAFVNRRTCAASVLLRCSMRASTTTATTTTHHLLCGAPIVGSAHSSRFHRIMMSTTSSLSSFPLSILAPLRSGASAWDTSTIRCLSMCPPSPPTTDHGRLSPINNGHETDSELLPYQPPPPTMTTTTTTSTTSISAAKSTTDNPPPSSRTQRQLPFRHFRSPTIGGGTTVTAANLRRPTPTTKRVALNHPQLHHNNNNNNNHQKTPHGWRMTTDNFPDETSVMVGGSCPVHAYHVAQSIDLTKVVSNVLAAKSVQKTMERLSCIVQLPPHESPKLDHDLDDQAAASTTTVVPRFVAIFRFGSVVFFNVSPQDRADLLWQIKQHSFSPVLSGSEHKEKFSVHIQPPTAMTTTDPISIPDISEDGTAAATTTTTNTLVEDSEPDVVTGDFCVVQELNMKAVDVISNVLAQSVALDSYNDTVDDLLADFERINKAVVVNGSLAAQYRDKMFRAVALNNAIFIEMVSKVGIKDRIDTAWNLSQYEDVSQGLIEEFDIELVRTSSRIYCCHLGLDLSSFFVSTWKRN
jgi:uncharacterized Rmd1/YagE family protein